jgi:hypothetical protein
MRGTYMKELFKYVLVLFFFTYTLIVVFQYVFVNYKDEGMCNDIF